MSEQRDALAAHETIRNAAKQHAIGSHARGEYDAERHWLDVLALLDQADKQHARLITEAKAEALRVVRLVESDMADRAVDAWRSADARRGLSDHEALIVHADALTRWSERLRMAMKGEDYRDSEADR